MQNNNAISKVAILFACIFLTHCASTRSPSGWLTDPAELPSDVYGGWITIETDGDSFSGELIAVAKDTIFFADSCLHTIPVSGIHLARLAAYNPQVWVITVGTILGTLSTASNGAFLLLTAPMWIIGGTISGAARSWQPILDYPDEPIERLAAYARFPQGLPSKLARNAITMKARQ
jgi:hypothetical protein